MVAGLRFLSRQGFALANAEIRTDLLSTRRVSIDMRMFLSLAMIYHACWKVLYLQIPA